MLCYVSYYIIKKIDAFLPILTPLNLRSGTIVVVRKPPFRKDTPDTRNCFQGYSVNPPSLHHYFSPKIISPRK